MKKETKKRVIEYACLAVFTLYFILKKLYLSEDSEIVYGDETTTVFTSAINWAKIPIWIALMAVSAGLIYWKREIPEKWSKILAYVTTILSPVFTFILLEVMWYHSWLLSGHMKLYNVFMNLFILGCIVLLVALITNSSRLATEIPLVAWYLFAVANLFVYRFRETALVISDFTSIGAAATVADEYDYTLNFKMLVGLVIVFDVFIFLHRFRGQKLFSKKARLIALGIWVIWAGIFVQLLRTEKMLLNARKTQYRSQKSYKENGTALTIFGSIQLLIVEKPEDYSIESVKAIMDGYESDEVAAFDLSNAPNIISIMDESFTDMASLYSLETSEVSLPFFNSLTENAVSGNMYVSVYGGQTANMEYEVLTGNTISFLPLGLAPFQSYLDEGMNSFSLARNYKAMGYEEAIAIHPYSSIGYNRIAAYDALGFDEFYDETDFSDPIVYRDYISDESSFDKIIEVYETSNENGDAPIFIHNVTMQNHGPYTGDWENLPLELSVLTEKYASHKKLQTFLNLTQKTDEAYKKLIEYFSAQEEPTIILIYGDHHPAINVKNGNGFALRKYVVPFKIWANFDIQEGYLEKISPNYLGAYVNRLAGCPETAYQKYLLDLYQDIPVISINGYFGADGVRYDLDDETSPYYERLQEYRTVQYNNLIDEEQAIEEYYFLK